MVKYPSNIVRCYDVCEKRTSVPEHGRIRGVLIIGDAADYIKTGSVLNAMSIQTTGFEIVIGTNVMSKIYWTTS